ncbi:MAG: PD40 domain-containing protein [Acidobacteria bacterium]|nr:PD40 domain-containing protein [Acidobacteriota bacterium]
MKHLRPRYIGAVLLTALGLSPAQEPPVVIRPKPGEEVVVAVADIQPRGGNRPAELARAVQELNQALWDDLKFAGFFTLPGKSFYPPRPINDRSQIQFQEWRVPDVDADFLAVGFAELAKNELSFEGWVYDVKTGKEAFGKRYRGEPELARRIAHRWADWIVYQLTAGASRGIASTRIAFERSPRRGNKEIFLMDYDGHHLQAVTANGTLNLSPSWGSKNGRLAYLTYRRGRPEINVYSIRDGSLLPFSSGDHVVGSPAVSPDGDWIAYAARHPANGYPNLSVARMDGTERRWLTSGSGVDTGPTWSPTGRQIGFVSDRSGSPQIYSIDGDGANLRRLVSEGGYADSPDWSPDGRFVAFAWRPPRQGHFDIYLVDVASLKIFQLTSHEGSNENPSWAPDGRHLAFQSNRNGSYQIYLMLADGSEQHAITQTGSNSAPAWSGYGE